jgi:hypothetical protein
MLIDVAISGDRNVIKKETEKRNSVHMECERRSDISKNRGDRNNLKIIQTIPEQHTGTTQNQESTKNKSHSGHCTHTMDTIMCTYKTHFTCEITLHVAQTVNTEQLQHYVYIPSKHGLFQVYIVKGARSGTVA